MLKSWQVETDNSLHVRKTGTIFLEKTKKSYGLGTGTYATRDDEDSINATTTDAAEAALETVISVTTTNGFTVGDNIGIRLDTDVIHWTTIDSFVPDDTVTIATAIPSAVALGNEVYTYTLTAPRPYKIMEVVLRDTSGQDRPLESISQQEYMEIADKGTTGEPSLYYYDPQLDNGKIYFWPVIDKNDYKIIYRYVKVYDDLDASSDNAEFPITWLLAIIYGLAMHLGVIYAVEDTNYKRIIATASRTFKRVNSVDVENTSIEFEPDPSEMR